MCQYTRECIQFIATRLRTYIAAIKLYWLEYFVDSYVRYSSSFPHWLLIPYFGDILHLK